MKKILFSLFTFVLATGMMTAQSAEDLYKEANNIWKKVVTADASEKMQLAKDAAAKLDAVMDGIGDLDEKKAAKAYKLRGEVNNFMANQDVNMVTLAQQTGKTHKVTDLNAGIKAYESYKMMYEKGTKKFTKRDAMTGMEQSLSTMTNMATVAYQQEDYKSAYQNFIGVSKGYDYITENGGKPAILSEEKDYDQNLLFAGLTANAAGMTAEATPIFEKLYEKKYNDAAVYDNLYKAYESTDEEKALKMLAEGREKFPENEGLLVTEINYYMKNDKLDELTGKLEKAIEMDPTNKSFYLALGSTYDNLSQRELKAGNKDKAKEFFDQAMNYYQQTLKIEEKNPTAVYSMGALYYNKAASMLTELIALEEKGDYSKAGLAKQEQMRTDILTEFKNALPHFQESEKLDPNDMNTLLALKEIYARMDDFKTSNEFKMRIEQVNAGQTIEKSYFADK